MPEITRGNPKAFDTITNKLKELEGYETKVGWFADAKYEDGTPVAYAAALNELGHGKTPARPFMRPTAIKERGKWSSVLAASAKKVLAGKESVSNAMETIGVVAEADVLKAIVSITTPPLSPITIQLRAMKMRDPNLKIGGRIVGEAAAIVHKPGYQTPSGVSTKPLNDTGTLIEKLTHKVDKASS